MISGIQTDDGGSFVSLDWGDDGCLAFIDTGFTGQLELPEEHRHTIGARHVGWIRTMLANGQVIDEEMYLVDVDFDERRMAVETTFAVGTSFGMIGTRLLTEHCLQIDFRTGAVTLSRDAPPCEVEFKVVTSQDGVADS